MSLAQLVQILLALSEFQAALDLGEAVLPFAAESEDMEVEARIWRSLCEACVGLASPGRRDSEVVNTTRLAQALMYVDRAHEGTLSAPMRSSKS